MSTLSRDDSCLLVPLQLYPGQFPCTHVDYLASVTDTYADITDATPTFSYSLWYTAILHTWFNSQYVLRCVQLMVNLSDYPVVNHVTYVYSRYTGVDVLHLDPFRLQNENVTITRHFILFSQNKSKMQTPVITIPLVLLFVKRE